MNAKNMHSGELFLDIGLFLRFQKMEQENAAIPSNNMDYILLQFPFLVVVQETQEVM